MKKDDLNIFEILGDIQIRPENQNHDQEHNAPDPFFHEEIKKAIDQNDTDKSQDNKKSNWIRAAKKKWKGAAIEIGIAILAVLFVFNCVISISRISGDSMKPNFCDNDRIVVFKLGSSFEQGDIIVFKTEDGEKLMKRVIAVAGDTVDINTQGQVLVNGKVLEEDYVYEETEITDQAVSYPLTVQEDAYFVLGDNRSHSIDSRNKKIGQIKKKDIIGRVILGIKGV